MKDAREEQKRAAKLLHDRRDSVEVQALQSWVETEYDMVRDALISADPPAIGSLQGQAKLLQKLRNVLKNGPFMGVNPNRE